VRALDDQSPLQDVARMDVEIGRLFARAANELLRAEGKTRADIQAIGSHGQTVAHQPGTTTPFTVQIGDPNIIAHETGIVTVADFRRMDVAAGGQGAPFAPAFHAFQFRRQGTDRAVLNIGGIANVTMLPADSSQPVIGFDTGPGNGLMDDWAGRHRGTSFDEGGGWAASGTVCEPLLYALLENDYFALPAPKSTGRDDFNLAWLDQRLKMLAVTPADVDVQATLLQLTARTIADAINTQLPDGSGVLVCGGGVHNPVLMDALRTALPKMHIGSTADAGVDPDSVEAVTFAWLAKCRLEGAAGNLPSVTGARDSVPCGGIYLPFPTTCP